MINAAKQILELIQSEFLTCFSGFPEVFCRLRPRQCQQGDMLAPMGTDGLVLYYDPEQVCQCFLQAPDKLKQIYLHLHLHCMCRHVIRPRDTEEKLWDAACDLAAAMLQYSISPEADTADTDRCLPGRTSDSSLNAFADRYPSLAQKPWEFWLDTPAVCALLLKNGELSADTSALALDTHQFWLNMPDSAASSGRAALLAKGNIHTSFQKINRLETVCRYWSFPRCAFRDAVSSGTGKRGRAPGRITEDADLKQRDSFDYHQFLHRFTVPGEEAVLDLDSFDYIPYHYGLTHYRNMPFIEPLEYREVHRLDELAIAIDTSASCSGQVVRRFLEETWNILRQRENFFSRMRLHLIQCDSMIQEYRVFTSVEEWEAAIPDLKIQGQGNTDFCPVFELLDRMIAQKEIRQLRGLLYFTDGDGIFPRKAPSYDTAFVFLNRQLEKAVIPDWAIRLNLNLPENILNT